MMSCITPTKRLDMWFKDLSVKTTEYSSSPSGSTSRRGRLTPADCHRTHHIGPPTFRSEGRSALTEHAWIGRVRCVLPPRSADASRRRRLHVYAIGLSNELASISRRRLSGPASSRDSGPRGRGSGAAGLRHRSSRLAWATGAGGPRLLVAWNGSVCSSGDVVDPG